LPSPYPSTYGDNHSEGSAADHASAAQYPVKQEVNYSTSGTPTSEYGVYPQSGRSGSFPEHIQQRPYHPSAAATNGGMAQQQNSPSMPQQDGRSHQAIKSNDDVPIDPSIAAPSPTYSYPQPSPYAPNPDMTHSYPHPNSGMYQPRPDWTGGYGQHGAPSMAPGHVYAPQTGSAAPQRAGNQVYSFVPIPGAQQHKRPRRRYEEIERMYKCGWNGCEKAYGTLNHLNAHVTMQSHGQKRTPEGQLKLNTFRSSRCTDEWFPQSSRRFARSGSSARRTRRMPARQMRSGNDRQLSRRRMAPKSPKQLMARRLRPTPDLAPSSSPPSDTSLPSTLHRPQAPCLSSRCPTTTVTTCTRATRLTRRMGSQAKTCTASVSDTHGSQLVRAPSNSLAKRTAVSPPATRCPPTGQCQAMIE
jgi:hypothetical protein